MTNSKYEETTDGDRCQNEIVSRHMAPSPTERNKNSRKSANESSMTCINSCANAYRSRWAAGSRRRRRRRPLPQGGDSAAEAEAAAAAAAAGGGRGAEDDDDDEAAAVSLWSHGSPCLLILPDSPDLLSLPAL